MKILSALVIFCIAGLISTSSAQEIPTPVKAKLVSNIQSIKPGDSFMLGVLFEIDPGWHIYWKFPGETGLPTKVEFNLPNGYQAEEVMWPIPSSYVKPDGGADYGYENSVLLWADIQVPPSLKNEGTSEIGVQISWVSCKEICIPGNKSLVYDLKISDETSWNGEDLFSEWHNFLPLVLSNRENPFDFEVTTKKADSDIINVSLVVKHKEHNGEIDYYPNPGNSLIVQNLKSAKSDNVDTTKITFDVIAEEGVVLSENVLDGLIVYSEKNGKRSAVEMKIDLNGT